MAKSRNNQTLKSEQKVRSGLPPRWPKKVLVESDECHRELDIYD